LSDNGELAPFGRSLWISPNLIRLEKERQVRSCGDISMYVFPRWKLGGRGRRELGAAPGKRTKEANNNKLFWPSGN
jgi:hypothetical protein